MRIVKVCRSQPNVYIITRYTIIDRVQTGMNVGQIHLFCSVVYLANRYALAPCYGNDSRYDLKFSRPVPVYGYNVICILRMRAHNIVKADRFARLSRIIHPNAFA